MTLTAGLDVGGAHLKIALADDSDSSRIVAVRQILCPLWQGLDKLDAALAEATPLLRQASRFGVTMTGELSDLFPDRKTGVETLVARLARELGDGARFWVGSAGFGSAEEALARPTDVGSTNFLATATFVARCAPDSMLIDFGSTTADILPIRDGRPHPCGLTDGERQTTGELVYTGFSRTAVMGVATRAPFKGRMQGLAREYLATMADVRRILGELPDGVDQHATADGRGTSHDESLVRFARMFGRDAAEGSSEDWRVAAMFVRDAQRTSIADGLVDVLAVTPVAHDAPIVGAGIGARDIEAIARASGRRFLSFGELADATPDCSFWATACAPAVSVARLLST